MKQQFPGTLALSERSRSLQELIRSMRKILGRGDLESEDHRKAALRRLLHGHAAGLTSAEIEELVVDLRGHFPDRIFESVSSARGLASRTAIAATTSSLDSSLARGSVHNRVRVEPEDQPAVERLTRYIMRPPISLDRMAWDGVREG